MHRTISSRRQCLRTASIDAIAWAQTTYDEVFNDLCVDGGAPDAGMHAEELRRYDSGFLTSPASAAGVPQRWAPIYDAAMERVYRKTILRRVEEILAAD
jgi:hypothetical protein